MRIIWYMVPEISTATVTFFVILGHFLPFYARNSQKNEKSTYRYYHFKEVYQKSWPFAILAHDRCNCYFSCWAIFCPFTPLTAQKVKIFKKMKKPLEISSFYTSAPKIMIIGYTVPEIWHMTDVIIFHFGLFFALLPP